MNLLEHTTNWVEGEIVQGKIMFVLGVVVLIGFITIFRSNSALLRGMLVPIGLILLILFGYGGYQIFGRPPHLNMVTDLIEKNPKQAIEQEYKKAEKDDSTYTMLKKVWVTLIVVSAFSYLFFSSNYLHGLSIGLVGLFATTLLVDSILHQRLLSYMKAMEELLR